MGISGRRIACWKCKRTLYPEKNEIYVIETFGHGKPYRIWLADLWACHGCGAQTITGFGAEPIAEHFESIFPEVLEYIKANNVPHCFIFEGIDFEDPKFDPSRITINSIPIPQSSEEMD